MLAMATCHECIRNPNKTYHGPSPDEITLVASAAKMGYQFIENSFQSIKLQCQCKDSQQTYEVKFDVENVFEFDSDRKRMSIVLANSQILGDKRLLLCKGADNVIQERLHSRYNGG